MAINIKLLKEEAKVSQSGPTWHVPYIQSVLGIYDRVWWETKLNILFAEYPDLTVDLCAWMRVHETLLAKQFSLTQVVNN